MEINGWAFAVIVVYLVVRNAWKYILLYKISGAAKKIKSMLPGGETVDEEAR